jgi:high-affinity iron transporter
MADGVGQELFNAGVLGLAVLMLAWHNIWMSRHARAMVSETRSVMNEVRDGQRDLSAVALVVCLAVLREGSETALFLFSLHSAGQTTAQVLGGGLLGLLTGALAGYLLYAGLLRIPVRHFFSVTSALVLFLAAGMAGQMARFLVQADLVPALASPLWDTSALLPTNSALGAVLHVLAGYDARPSGMQTVFYAIALGAILVGMRLARPGGTPARA